MLRIAKKLRISTLFGGKCFIKKFSKRIQASLIMNQKMSHFKVAMVTMCMRQRSVR